MDSHYPENDSMKTKTLKWNEIPYWHILFICISRLNYLYLQSSVVEKLFVFWFCSQGHGFTGTAGVVVVVVVILGGPSIGASGWLMSYKNSGIIGTKTNILLGM